jgi:hypothetical protein
VPVAVGKYSKGLALREENDDYFVYACYDHKQVQFNTDIAEAIERHAKDNKE